MLSKSLAPIFHHFDVALWISEKFSRHDIHRLVGVTAFGTTVLPRSLLRWQHPATQVHRVMDLGFRSNPNLHRAHGGPFRVRIEARLATGGAGQISVKRIERIELYVGDRNGEKSGRRPGTHSSACLPSPQRKLELPAARKMEVPLSRFPLRGKAGASGFPPHGWHAAHQQTALATHRCRGSPRKGGFKALH
jgi:hypothetical protein